MGIAVVFPGQGSQAPGWGEPWRDEPAWAVVEQAEAVLGEAVAPLLLDQTAPLERTRDAQLAVLLSALVAWEAVRERVTTATGAGQLVAVAGHSLGQLSALIAASTLSLEDGLHLVASRAEVTQTAADRRPGRMAALLGATPEQAAAACAAVGDGCWVANDNAPGQIVISGTPEGVDAAIEAAKASGVRRAIPLKVDGGFHTPLMAEARTAFAEALATVPLADSAVPVVSNADAVPYTDGEGWRARLADHLVSPVRWRESLLALTELGVTRLVEVGPGETLTGMARRTVPDIELQSIATPESIATAESEASS